MLATRNENKPRKENVEDQEIFAVEDFPTTYKKKNGVGDYVRCFLGVSRGSVAGSQPPTKA